MGESADSGKPACMYGEIAASGRNLANLCGDAAEFYDELRYPGCPRPGLTLSSRRC